ncbi:MULTISPECIES: UvrD-helicase domain-containing protein [unclassified Chryseobacterium]|uniref:UvrD-helicase domain-containing protein n=1 Tax=unclassified Chryseobacterium TaxID=2593645 RepID=UPI00100B9936|nr:MULTISPECIES: ATP-dependent helicase [unclassified Chryseobacterium]RXM52926.1 DNA helicase UvrD [Chryseobacterium sp. CH25]RXM65877.1 DNA helicase UvrD [Chryseobacterium sp. CH1]
MKRIKPELWVPADDMQLESNALEIAKSSANHLVVAGPGAGKTELLAQKACYLLQTNTCPFPYKILAISFKKDAAYNLKERVRERCGGELSKRFDSMTFDSFAKQLLDRFKQALPDEYKFGNAYEVVLSDRAILEYYQSEDVDYFNSTNKDQIFALHNAQLPHSKNTAAENIRNKVWSRMLQSTPSALSFPMIMRLAELIIIANPKIKQYLQQTYKYVFLDEFQDTTDLQYELFKSCFLDSDSFFTAVGDDKQRIMMWAGARETVFDDFIRDAKATRVPLTMNFRCAPRLVHLLNHLTKDLLGKTDLATPSSKWHPDQGDCFVWTFKNPDVEMQVLFQEVSDWIKEGAVTPRDICILVKQNLSSYAGKLIEYFNANGINARDESKFQDILTQEVCEYIINALYTIFDKKNFEAKKYVFDFISNLRTEMEDTQLLKLEWELLSFVKEVRKKYVGLALTEDNIKELVSEIMKFADTDRIIAYFPNYRNSQELINSINKVQDELITNYTVSKDIILALDTLVGKDTIPVMTIHKSKGLEYHTVIFIGLEDGAFWSFQRQPDEDKCAFFVALSRAKERVVFTFSNEREGRFGTQVQSIENIRIIFEELQKSGIVTMTKKTLS